MRVKKFGSKTWFIPDGFIPVESSEDLISHEAVCLLNCNNEIAEIYFTIYFEDQDPLVDIEVLLEGNRTKHLKTKLIKQGDKGIPKGVPYAIKVSSNIPIIVQYSRMDTTQPANTLMTTIGHPID